MGKSKLPIIAGGDGVKGVLKTYPTEFGVSRGDLCSIVPKSSGYKRASFSALADYDIPSLVSVLLDYDKIFYASGDTSYPSSGLSLYIYDYNSGTVTTTKTSKALVPIAVYRINDNTIRLYCLNSTFKQVQVFNVDISTGTPKIGSSILSFASSSPTYKYFVRDNGFSRMCSLGNNRYILFSEICEDEGASSVWGAGSEIQCTPIYDDGTTIVKGTPITQEILRECNFACCASSENTALLAPIYKSQSDSTLATLKLIGFVFSEDSSPILTKQEFSVPSTTGIYAENYKANNMYLLKLQDDNYGLVLLDEYNLCRIIHYSIINNVVSIVGSITQFSDGKIGVADIVGQQMVIAIGLAGASSTSATNLHVRVLDMTSEPTVVDSTSISDGAWGRLGAALSVHSTISTLYVSSVIRMNSNARITKAKVFDTVEKNINCVYANKNAIGNTYGEFKQQE